jgi:selenide, water dikinase
MFKLTSYSRTYGCSCKIPSNILSDILKHTVPDDISSNLLVGNDNRDDAAVLQIDRKNAIISTTDFFTPIVDDAFDYGAIAAANAISDVYAMGGIPLMAVAILGWPINKIEPHLASEVIQGAQKTCQIANIPLAGGHSIVCSEPIFGLAVTGKIKIKHIKNNSATKENDDIYITKPLGIGILANNLKDGKLNMTQTQELTNVMKQLNFIGAYLAKIKGVHSITDVTGFGLLGHLSEILEGSNVSATLDYKNIPIISFLKDFINTDKITSGARKNYGCYKRYTNNLNHEQIQILCDPQTNGGLLITANKRAKKDILKVAKTTNTNMKIIGKIGQKKTNTCVISVL